LKGIVKNVRLFNDYFSNNAVYTDEQFCRSSWQLHDAYFTMRVDATGRRGLSPLQKCTVAIRMLAYGSSADSVDDYVQIGETTTMECLDKFVRGVHQIYGAEYLRKPSNNDIERLLQIWEAHGFSGICWE
jgi:hypothetical protein